MYASSGSFSVSRPIFAAKSSLTMFSIFNISKIHLHTSHLSELKFLAREKCLKSFCKWFEYIFSVLNFRVGFYRNNTISLNIP